jgi:hypothetical protein
MAEMSGAPAIAAAPITAIALIGAADWQVVFMLGIALVVSLWRVVDADPALPTRKAVMSVAMGLVFTLVFAPAAGVWIADQFAVSSLNAVMIATVLVSVGWLKIYKVIESDLIDSVMSVITRTLKAFFGAK